MILKRISAASSIPARRAKPWQLFAVVLAVHLAATALYQETIWTKEVYTALFAEQLEGERLEELLNGAQRFTLIGYLTLPLTLFLRIVFVGALLQFGFLVMWREVRFAGLFRVLSVASLTGVATLLVKTIWFSIAPPVHLTQVWLMEIPFSLGQLVSLENYALPARVVLQSVNLFEAAWIVLVWLGVARVANMPKGEAGVVVAGVWGVMVLLQVGLAWVTTPLH